MKRKIIYLLVAIALAVTMIFGELIVYVINQGAGQAKILLKAKPLTYYLNDSDFPDSLKQKIRLIEEVRQYAIDSLGLRDTDVYKKMYDQQGQEVMWVVTACQPFELTPKMWSFPIVGAVPYKGYFGKKRAIREKEKLEKEGWEVSVRNPGGWSTLGWFNDPILSGMLGRSEGDLASLIIHEMVHSTVWIKNDVAFNENLASFIGDTAAYQFLAHRYGRTSAPYNTYLHEDQDYRIYSKYILAATQRLDSLYKTFTPQQPVAGKRQLKEKIIRSIVQCMDTLPLQSPRKPSARFAGKLPNNTYFMVYRHYQSKQTEFADELQKAGGNLRTYIKQLAARHPA